MATGSWHYAGQNWQESAEDVAARADAAINVVMPAPTNGAHGTRRYAPASRPVNLPDKGKWLKWLVGAGAFGLMMLIIYWPVGVLWGLGLAALAILLYILYREIRPRWKEASFWQPLIFIALLAVWIAFNPFFFGWLVGAGLGVALVLALIGLFI